VTSSFFIFFFNCYYLIHEQNSKLQFNLKKIANSEFEIKFLKNQLLNFDFFNESFSFSKVHGAYKNSLTLKNKGTYDENKIKQKFSVMVQETSRNQ
jgi:hypothetical protein